MKRLRRRTQSELSLVPLADMLTNTVGIVLFILIFTVLAAGGAVVAKRLPLERSTDASAVHFMCDDGRIYPVDASLIKALLERTGPIDGGKFQGWAKAFDGKQVKNDDIVVTGKAGLTELTSNGFTVHEPRVLATVTARPGGGERAVDATRPSSRLRATLASLDPNKSFAHFLVAPNGIAAFNVARAEAAKFRLQPGWVPISGPEGVTFTLLGSGRSSRVL